MRIRTVLVAVVFLALFSTSALCVEGPLLTLGDGNDGGQHDGVAGGLSGGSKSFWLAAEEIHAGKEASAEATMPDPVLFLLRRGSPNGTNLTAVYGEAGENLLGTLPPQIQGFDEYGELQEGFSIQVAICDLNGDKKPEVLVAVGDGATVLSMAVFVDEPHEAGRFRCIGVIEGQSRAHVEADGTISVPCGLRGLFTKYAVSAGGTLGQSE